MYAWLFLLSLSTPVFSCLSTKQSTGPVSGSVLCAFWCGYESETTYLQTAGALNQRGEHYKVNQLQHYSERLGRMVTKYVLEKAETDETGKHISTRVLETYSMADVVKTLAKIYSG